jgi:hypothetical protein
LLGAVVFVVALSALFGGWMLWKKPPVAALRRRFARLGMGSWGILLCLLLAVGATGFLAPALPPPAHHALLVLARFCSLLALALMLFWMLKIKHIRYSLRWLGERLHLQDFTPADQSLFAYIALLALVGLTVLWSLPPSLQFLWPWGLRLLLILFVWLLVLLLSRQPLLRRAFRVMDDSWTQMGWRLEERLWFTGIVWSLSVLLFLRWLLPSEMASLVQLAMRWCATGLVLVFVWSLARQWLLPVVSRSWYSLRKSLAWGIEEEGPTQALLWLVGLSFFLRLLTPTLFAQLSLLLAAVALGLTLLLLKRLWDKQAFVQEEQRQWKERFNSLEWSEADRSFWVALGTVAFSSLLVLLLLPEPWPLVALVVLRVEAVLFGFWLWSFSRRQQTFRDWSRELEFSLEKWGWRQQDSRWLRLWLGATGFVALLSVAFSSLATGLWFFWGGTTWLLCILLGGALLWRQGWLREQLENRNALERNQQELDLCHRQLERNEEQLSATQDVLERYRVLMEESRQLLSHEEEWEKRFGPEHQQLKLSVEELERRRERFASQSERNEQALLQNLALMERQLEKAQAEWSEETSLKLREEIASEFHKQFQAIRKELQETRRQWEEQKQSAEPVPPPSFATEREDPLRARLHFQQEQMGEQSHLWMQLFQWLEDTRTDWQRRQVYLQQEQSSLRAIVEEGVLVLQSLARWPDRLRFHFNDGRRWLSNLVGPWRDRAFSQWRDDRSFWVQTSNEWRARLPLVELTDYEKRFVKTLLSMAVTLGFAIAVLPNSAATLLLWGMRLEIACVGLLLLFVLSRQTLIANFIEQIRSFVGLVELDEDKRRTLFAMTWALLLLSALALAIPPGYQVALVWMGRLLLLLGAGLLWTLLSQQLHVQTLQQTGRSWLEDCVWTPADRGLLRLLTWSGGLLLGSWWLLPLPDRSGWLWAFRVNLALLWVWAMHFAMREAHIQRWWLRFDSSIRRAGAARGWRLWSVRAVLLWLGGTGVTFGLQMMPLFWVWQGMTALSLLVYLSAQYSSLQNWLLGRWMQQQGLLHRGEEIQQGSWRGRIAVLGPTFCELETEDGLRIQLPYHRLRQEGFVQVSRAAFRAVRLETRLDPGSFEPAVLLELLEHWLEAQEGLAPSKQSAVALGDIDERGQRLEVLLYLTPQAWREQHRHLAAELMEELGRAEIRLGLPQQTVLLWNQEE